MAKGTSDRAEALRSGQVDVDGVIQADPPGRVKAIRTPTLMRNLLAGATASLEKVAWSIYSLDIAIEGYAELLARAQPLNSGRVVIVFSKTHRVRINGSIQVDVAPVAMRMVLYISGTWHLRRPPAYSTLEELRVGKNLPSDRLVVQILRELDKLFLARRKLLAYLQDFRKPVIPAMQSAGRQVDVSLVRLPKLRSRLKLDWKADAKGCRKAIRDERKDVAQKRKADAIRKREAAHCGDGVHMPTSHD